MRLRNICFTINNWSTEDWDSLLILSCKYLVVGKEVGENGTPHLQGYIEFNNAVHFNSLKKKLPRAHMEKRMGNAKQASDYCKKDGDFFEKGEISQQGKRTDIDNICELISDGNSNKDIIKTCPSAFFKFHKHISVFRSNLLEPRNFKPMVSIFFGTSGTGKTRAAVECFKDESYYMWGPEQTKWWDGYEGQKKVIMDEFRGQLPLGYILRLLDRYQMKVELKGSMCEFVADEIIITSPCHPRLWYAQLEQENVLAQLLRRIDCIKLFRDNGFTMDVTILGGKFGN